MECVYLRRCVPCAFRTNTMLTAIRMCKTCLAFSIWWFNWTAEHLHLVVHIGMMCARCIIGAFGCWCQAFASILRFFPSGKHFCWLFLHNSKNFHLRWLNASRDWYLSTLPFANTHLHRRCGTIENVKNQIAESHRMHGKRAAKPFVEQSQSCVCGERCCLSCKTNTIGNSIVGPRVYATFAINSVWMRIFAGFGWYE